MTDRKWLGGGDNKASDANNWSPTGTPQRGDSLTMSTGTMNITDNDLRGDLLSIAGVTPVTINVKGIASLKLADSGPSLHVVPPSPATVDLSSHSMLIGNFSMSNEDLTILGSDHTAFINNGTDSLIGSLTTIAPDVLGRGTFIVQSEGSARAAFPGSLEFGGFVSVGQTVELTGAVAGPRLDEVSGALRLDAPQKFFGTVELHDRSLVELARMAAADSWSYGHDLLFMFDARGRPIDILHVVSDAPSTGDVHGLLVSKNAAGDVHIGPGTDFHGSIAMPTT